MEEMELNHFMKILLLNSYFKIKDWIYRSILGVLIKKFIKSYFILGSIWEFIREWNGMEWNVFKQVKGMEKNGMEWN